MKHLRSQRGDTIIEVLISVTVLSLILTISFSLTNRNMLGNRQSAERSEAYKHAVSQIELLRTYMQDLSAFPTPLVGDNKFCVATTASGPKLTVISGIPDDSQAELQNKFAAYDMDPVKTDCKKGEYYMHIEKDNDTYTAHARWYKIGGDYGIDEAKMVYRIYASPITAVGATVQIPPATPAPTPAPTPSECARGQTNFIRNGNFTITAGRGPDINPAAQFTSELPNRGDDTYPDDFGIFGTSPGFTGGLSIQEGGSVYYPGGYITGRPFPGDQSRNAPPSNTYFYSNPLQYRDGKPGPFKGIIWQQQVDGLLPNTKYIMTGYFDNLINPTQAAPGAKDPLITLQVNGLRVSPQIRVGLLPDEWIPVWVTFTTNPGQTSAIIGVYDSAFTGNGDDFGMTGLGIHQCF